MVLILCFAIFRKFQVLFSSVFKYHWLRFSPVTQIVFDEKELRREISHAIKNVHGVRQVKPRQDTCPTSKVVPYEHSSHQY